MIAGFGMHPEAWLRMQAQEIERGLATRRPWEPERAALTARRASSRDHMTRGRELRTQETTSKIA